MNESIEKKHHDDEYTEQLTDDKNEKLLRSAARRVGRKILGTLSNDKLDIARDIGEARQDRQKQRDAFLMKRMEVEKQLNDKLTSIEEIAAAAEAGVQAEARCLEYGGTKVPVYDMKGYPVTLLSHDVGFKSDDTPVPFDTFVSKVEAGIPVEPDTFMSSALLEHPELWNIDSPTRGEFLANKVAADNYVEPRLSNVISTSYFDSETMSRKVRGVNLLTVNLRTHAVRYGFDHVRAGSLYNMSKRDGAVPSYIDDDKKDRAGKIVSVADLEKTDSTLWNEVTLLRYDDQGRPLKPSYLVTLDGRITEDTLKHAAFFEVPIVNIEAKYYDGGEEGRLRTGDGDLADAGIGEID